MATRKKPVSKMTRGERACAFIQEFCRVPEGALVGQPLILAPFQKRFILAIYDSKVGTRRAFLSIARKNGKTGLIAAILLVHLVGPEAKLNSQIVSGARSREQAGQVFNYASKMVTLNPELGKLVKIIPSGKRLIGINRNVEYRALAAEGSTAMGLSPVLAIMDELGQIRGQQDDFVDAITTSQGAHDAPLLIGISTMAPTDADLFSIWLDDAIKSKDPRIVCHVYDAPKDADLLSRKAWKAANPGLGLFRSLEDIREQAEAAYRMPSNEATFRNLCLNQRVEVTSPFVTRKVWQENGAIPALLEGLDVYGGLDLSSVSDLTALVLVSEYGDVHSTFWLPAVGLAEKSKKDRVPYDMWAKMGYLETTPGRAIEYEFVAEHLRGVFDRCNVKAIAFDRYNMRFLRPWLEKVGFSDDELDRFREFGQGFVSMSPALRELESRLLMKKLKHGNQPVLTMCANNATVLTDPAGNRKFIKGKATGRIDGMVSLAMAVGVMPAAETVETSFWETTTDEKIPS